MYICQVCEKVTQPKEPQNLVVIETRNKIYPPRPEVGDPGGSGYEIAREIKVCIPCIEEASNAH